MKSSRILIIGAGIAGLAAAVRLSKQGQNVTLFERQAVAGGKIRSCERADIAMDVGPTVATLTGVFESLFEDCGLDLHEQLELVRLDTIARHFWRDGSVLDLHADQDRTYAAIGEFAGSTAVGEYRQFSARARRLYEYLEATFLTRPQQGLAGLLRNTGIAHASKLSAIRPFTTLWSDLGRQFSDYRLQQLFARYATYCGSSPFLAPATLALIAHVEQAGVWRIRGGLRALASTLAEGAEGLGAELRVADEVSDIELAHGRVAGLRLASGEFVAADHVLFNGDTQAIAEGFLGDAVASAVRPTARRRRSLSALTFAGTAASGARPLQFHNVFFSDDYEKEFTKLGNEQLPTEQPTVYVCAPDHDGGDNQRFFLLINAPANGDSVDYPEAIVQTARRAIEEQLSHCGISLPLDDFEVTTPNDFHRRYPATGGALYGPAMHGWRAAFQRPGSVTRIKGLFVAGGSVHPGSGVPMAALSGCLAADSILTSLHGKRDVQQKVSRVHAH